MTFQEFIENNDISNIEAFRVFLDNEHLDNQDSDIIEESDYSEYLNNFNDSFCGEQSIENYASDYVEEIIDDSNTPEFLKHYIDRDALISDVAIDLRADMWEDSGFLFRAY